LVNRPLSHAPDDDDEAAQPRPPRLVAPLTDFETGEVLTETDISRRRPLSPRPNYAIRGDWHEGDSN
jgi:hypothetical protein